MSPPAPPNEVVQTWQMFIENRIEERNEQIVVFRKIR